MLVATFKGKEFFRVGYYVNNSIPELENVDGMPVDISKVDISKVQRAILSEKPKIIHYPINWEEEEKEMILLSEMMGGGTEKINQNFLNVSDNSINFAGIFDKGTQGQSQSTDLFANPSQTAFGLTNQFTGFGSGLFGNNTENGGVRSQNNNGLNTQGGFGLFSNNTPQMQVDNFQQPFSSQSFGMMGVQQQMMPVQQNNLFDMQGSGFNMGIGQQPFSQGSAFTGFGQNYQ